MNELKREGSYTKCERWKPS